MTDPDELPPDLRRWLDSVRDADDPAPSDRARIDAAFSSRLRALGITAPLTPQHLDPASGSAGAHASASAGAHGSAATSGALGFSGKIALALIGAGVAAAASYFALTREPSDAAKSTAPVSRIAPALRGGASIASRAAPAPAPAIEAPSRVLDGSAPPPKPVATQAREPIESRSRAHASAATLGKGAGAEAAPARNTGAPAPLPPDFLREEIALIESANDALHQHRYAAALQLLEAHESRFALGALGEERRGLRVLALCGLGKLTAGREQRARFLRDAPHSVLASKVEAACAAEGDTTPLVEGER